jgi:hypothetical protein
MPDMDMREDYSRTVPADDVPRFSSQISKIVEKVTRLAGSATNPAGFGGCLATQSTSSKWLRDLLPLKLVALSKIIFLQKFLASMNVRLVEGRISNLFRSIENVAASD